jgi:hypothetical protein
VPDQRVELKAAETGLQRGSPSPSSPTDHLSSTSLPGKENQAVTDQRVELKLQDRSATRITPSPHRHVDGECSDEV